MIILSGVLVVVAFALLIVGIVAGNGADAQVLGIDARMVIYASIGVSIASAVFLIIGVFLRRNELFGVGAAPARPKPAKSRRSKQPARKAAASGSGTATATAVADSAGKVPDEALVHVVPGRKRYHLATCRQLAGRDTEELTYIEAREEGFSPCTACMPDTALAARAAASAPESAEAGGPAKGRGKRQDRAAGRAKAAKKTDAAEPGRDKAAGRGDRPSGADTADGGTAVPSKPGASTRPLPDEPAAAAAPAPAPVAPAASGAPSAPAAPAPASPRAVPSAWSPPKSSPEGRTESVSRPSSTAGRSRPRSATVTDDGEAAESDPKVCILSGTKRFHRVDCALIEDIGETEDLETLPLSQAQERGCTPCLVCQPDKTSLG
ncbi:hypothetical protein [uncultured Thermomonospora sp.]|uniref:hypothetical protein n=1 Tax=uncultured Thermomonospora sp. TaxID=671175 RepID=UPI00259B6827|nr:hypothetical protein [uncultured Thermomonospora sp.]